MSVIVHNGTEHVEQKRRALRGNKISCRRLSMVGAKAAPLHPFRIVIKRKITPQRRIQRHMTSPIPPEVHALTWQGYVAHIVRMVSCIAMSFA